MVKTKAITFGKWRLSADHPFGISWPDSCKILGVKFGRNITPDDNWNEILTKFHGVLNFKFKDRYLSVYGKSLIVKVMAMSKVWYVASVLPMPRHFVDIFTRVAFDFFWGSHLYEPLARSILYNVKELGGVNFVHLPTKLHASRLVHLHKIINNYGSKFVHFSVYWIGLSLRNVNPSFASNNVPHSDYVPPYYKKCLESYRYFMSLFPDFNWTTPMKSSDFYKMLIPKVCTVSKVSTIFSSIDFKRAFTLLDDSFLDPLIRNFNWKLLHDIVPTNFNLYCKKHTLNKFCTFVPATESVEHLFFYCPMVSTLWSIVRNWVLDLSFGLIDLDGRVIRFNLIDVNIDKYRKKIILYLVCLAKHQIWLDRCNFKHGRKR